MDASKEQKIKRSIDFIFKQIFSVGWFLVLIFSMRLINGPIDTLSIFIFIAGIIGASIATTDLLTNYFSTRIFLLILKRAG
jgi:hypothetical protein